MADQDTTTVDIDPELNGAPKNYDEDDAIPPAPVEEVFDEVEPEVSVKIRDANKTVHEYFVRQFELATKTTSGGLALWMKNLGRRIKTDETGKVVSQDYVGFHEDLIALCLYDAAGNRVPKPRIAAWSPRIKNHLFDLCQKINGLSQKARAAEGKA